MPDETPRFSIVSDDSGHKYLIPAEYILCWWTFMEEGKDEVPDWAQRLNGPLSLYSFTDFREHA